MKNLALLIGLYVLLFSACTPTYYAPGTMAAPGLKEKGDIKIGVHSSSSSDSESSSQGTGFDLELAYSPIENLGLLYHSNSFSDGFSNPVNERSGPYGIPVYDYISYVAKGSIHNLGAGYYKNLNPDWIWESYATAGLGSFEIKSKETSRNITADLRKMSLQTGVLFRKSFFEFGATYGLSTLSYNNIQGEIINFNDSQNNYLTQRSNHLLSNFASTLRLGYKPVKIQMQIGATKNLSHDDFKMNDAYASLGLFLNVDELIKR